MMHRALKTFDDSLRRASDLGGLYAAIQSLTTKVIDPSDLLRSQIVLAISALDHLVHELTVTGMLEVFDGNRTPTPAYARFAVPLGVLTGSPHSALSRSAFESAIREKHSYLSFQRPEKIAEAIRLFFPHPIWERISNHVGTDPSQLKARLDLAVDRRNKIAHEADVDPSFPEQRWPISVTDTESVIDITSQIGHGIFHVVGGT